MAVTINGTTGIVTPDIGVDGTTLVIDAVNDRIGIGTTTPFGKLQVRPGTNANFSFSTGGGESSLEILNDAGSANVPLNVRASEYKIKIQGTEKVRIDSDGHVTPGGDDTQDLGSASKRWRNIYTGDLQLSNEGSSNEIDGTWGNYTIQEGEEELFLINRRSGKKFKFVLEEVK